MAECIDREAFKKSVEERYCKPCKAEGEDHNGCWCRTCWVDDMLDEADCFQSSDVAPVKHARNLAAQFNETICTNCGVHLGEVLRIVREDNGDDAVYYYQPKHCANCGAKFDGGASNVGDN